MKCDKCGTEIAQGHRCLSCGASLVSKVETAKFTSKKDDSSPTLAQQVNQPVSQALNGGFWNFDLLMTTSYIKFIFFFWTIMIGLGALSGMIIAVTQKGFWGFLFDVPVSLFCAAIAFLILRLCCAALIIFFKMFEELKKINDNTSKSI